ncbi:hypothetical protein [Vineibacter terrae]|uniref:hypothetical protein n=1 Tax=Vineibacter terrae TaxID=2586908 RepID=UPI002E358F56|nr:hypothetical protein [Vineibacter terrae]HEX2886052.1 hypothetical protein [Vineibacter terrae]
MTGMIPGLSPRATIPLKSIEPDATTLERWCGRGAVVISLLILVILVVVGPRPLGSAVSRVLLQPVDPFIGWLIGVLGAALCPIVALDRWLARHSGRVDVDRAGRLVRVVQHGLWRRRNEAMPLGDVRDLALVQTQDDGARAWRLELRPTRAGARKPLVVATTHDVGRLEAVARSIAREAGLELVRVSRRSRPPAAGRR